MASGPRSENSYLLEAKAICHDLRGTVWYEKKPERRPGEQDVHFVYHIYRRGMGRIATRNSPSGLVAYLRKQHIVPKQES